MKNNARQKTVSMPLGQLLDAQGALGELSALKLPAFLSFRTARNMKAIQAEFDAYNAARKEVFERLGEGADLKIPAEKMVEFSQEIEQLRAQVVEVRLQSINYEELGLRELSPACVMSLLGWLLADGEDEAEADSGVTTPNEATTVA